MELTMPQPEVTNGPRHNGECKEDFTNGVIQNGECKGELTNGVIHIDESKEELGSTEEKSLMIDNADQCEVSLENDEWKEECDSVKENTLAVVSEEQCNVNLENHQYQDEYDSTGENTLMIHNAEQSETSLDMAGATVTPLYPVGRFTGTVIKCPIIVMAICFLVSVVLSIIGFSAAGSFSGSFTDLSDPIVRMVYAADRASYSWEVDLGGINDDNTDDDDVAQQTQEMANPMQIIIHSKVGQALGYEALKQFAKLQNEIVTSSGFKNLCLRSASDTSDVSCRVPSSPVAIANYAVNSDGDGDTADACECASDFDVACSNFDSKCASDFGGIPTCDSKVDEPSETEVSYDAFAAMCNSSLLGAVNSTCGSTMFGLRLDTVGKSWDCTTLKTRWARLLIPYGTPFKVGEDDDDELVLQREDFEASLLPRLYALREKIEDEYLDLQVFFWGFDQIPYYLDKDLRVVLLAICFVFLVLCVHTDSYFVASCGLFEIIISYPLGLFVWHAVLQQPYVTYLMYSGIFVILGIGADDIFVLSDAFKQSAFQPPHISGSLETRFAWAYNRAASAMLATSLTTVAAFTSCAATTIWDIAAFGCVAAVMIACDYILVITWLPSAMIINERYLQNICTWFTPSVIVARVFYKKKKENKRDEDEEEEEKPRTLEAFYGGVYADFVNEKAKLIMAGYAVFFVVATVTAGLCIQPDTKAPAFFSDDHFFVRSQEISADKFGITQTEEVGYLPFKLTFGLKINDPWDTKDVHPCDVREDLDETKANFKPGFDVADHQQELSDACAAFQTSILNQGIADASSYYCWIDDFATWAEDNGYTFPIAPTSDFLAAALAWQDSITPSSEEYADRTGFLEDGERVYFSFATFNTTMTDKDYERGAIAFSTMWDRYDSGNKALKAAEDAIGGLKGTQSIKFYPRMVSSRSFVFAAFTNLTVGIILAVVVIGAMTMNWKITGIATGALVVTVACVFFIIVIVQWKINIIESIGISLAAGMAVDYVLHLAHSFKHQHGTPPEKVKAALGEMGISVTYGMATAFVSCICLFACDFLWFQVFGGMICIIVFSSFFVAMFGMMAALSWLGPGDAPDGVIECPKCFCFKKKPVAEEVYEMTPTPPRTGEDSQKMHSTRSGSQTLNFFNAETLHSETPQRLEVRERKESEE
mmetsp:Transcript_31035/g.42030  ORF Transcript_31035/g.42030 Transcript_31035/m.42030 type:complete len:1162 (-) Transcript_31035:162-3647(-)|eukprot:CAMPEP_0185757988 /NCGR_PEP_ID=MMETSP1174-20130828/16515_1 /TAXON_ID=35687 /ORGANISM="Dictyocha speculum, Strain CCMP1381" /LENGTH=1161 /DNA_ID=CAMNT_0028437621 /DNA_START=274 /DNA_END=3759 /DNA_ORIENTATION=-